MSGWQNIATAPKDGTFVLLHHASWPNDVEGFWHRGTQSWSANTRIPDLENRVVGPEPPTHWNRSPPPRKNTSAPNPAHRSSRRTHHDQGGL